MEDARLIGALAGSLTGGLVSFACYYFLAKVGLAKAILIALVTAIGLLIGSFIGVQLFYTR